MRLSTIPLALGAVAFAACGDDGLRKVTCIEEASAFNIDEVSTLELVHALPLGSDAVILDADRSKLGPDDHWRVGAVEVFVAIPDGEFWNYPTDVKLAVEVWDADRPDTSTPWTVVQTLDTAALSWTTGLVKKDREGFASKMKTAWWKFDFSNVIPQDGMSSPRYVVGVHWLAETRPLLGASNYDRACQLNWTDYNDARGWVLNPPGSTCSWPMFRVAGQTIGLRDACE